MQEKDGESSIDNIGLNNPEIEMLQTHTVSTPQPVLLMRRAPRNP
jgi:hypothetical protein